ncbi:MAG: hypothetical protein J6W29_01215 [Neisseriaceae bacterium]|nr:hypothetical protein [Neisseriaceae bacterium]
MIKKITALTAVLLSLTACDKMPMPMTKSNQNGTMEISTPPGNWTLEDIEWMLKNGKKGQVVAFLPNRWGNAQLPLVFVHTMCDTNYQVIMNESGVVCTYTDVRLREIHKNLKKKSK